MKLNRFVRWIACAGFGMLLIPGQLLALDPSRSVYQYNCRTWTRQTGLPVNGIRAIAQTGDGYIWLGTQKGLVRFDGIEFKTTPMDQRRLQQGTVACLANSAGGGLWFGIEFGEFGFWDGANSFSMESLPWVSPQMRTAAICEARDGWLWVGAGGGVGRCQRGGTNGSVVFNQLTGVSAICEDSGHRIWFGTTDEGLYYWDAGQLKPFADVTLKREAIFALAVDLQHLLWVGTQAGVHCYDTNFVRRELVPSSTDMKALLADQNGAVWIGSAGDGLIRYQAGKINYLRTSDGLAHDFVTALLEDNEGNVWVGTREGLSELSDVKFPIYTSADGMVGGSCHGLCSSRNGGIWTANTRGLSRFDGMRFTNFSQQIGLVNPYVKRVFEAHDGDVYFINAARTGDREVDVLSGGKVVARYPNKNWPIALAEDARGVVVGVAGELFRVSRTEFVPFVYKDGKPPEMNWVRNLFGCADGSLLVASVNGVFRLQDGVVEHWSVTEGLADADVIWVCEDDERTIWAGLTVGMARIRGKQVRSITKADGLPDNTIRAIVPDDRGDMWLYSNRGFLRVNRRNLNDFADGRTNRVGCVVFDGLESVKTIDTSDVEAQGCKTPDGRIWFPSPHGAVMIDPARIPVASQPPVVHIEQVQVNGVDLPERWSGRTRPGRGELLVRYTALSYIAPLRIRFRYRLEGFDTDWVDAENRRAAFYVNLAPRHYRFAVQACNVDGVWSRASEFVEIELPPHFYQTTWFRLFLGLVLVAALWGGFRWRVLRIEKEQRKLQQANDVLEAKVQQRTGELAEQRNLLRTLIDHLPDSIFVKDNRSRVVVDNMAHARSLGLTDPAQAVGKTDFDCLSPEWAGKLQTVERELLERGTSYDGEEEIVDARTGELRWVRTTKVPLRDQQGKVVGLAGINRDITERKKWEVELNSLHRKLVEASRQAGMAEVATSVLHNVGNVLNSVNVSSSVVVDRIKSSRALALEKVVRLLKEHEGDLTGFLAQDPKGRRVMAYLESLAKCLDAERNGLLGEMRHLRRNLDHVNEIVARQQTYAKVVAVSEILPPAELVEDALRIHEDSFRRHSIHLIREFSQVPPINVDRHRLIEILVNLLQNAIRACERNGLGGREVTVRILSAGPDRVRIEVADNGMGIPPENLTRIFAQGFTTRKNGHGFGLHSGALAAKQLRGALTATSEGHGKGAVFTLELPIQTS